MNIENIVESSIKYFFFIILTFYSNLGLADTYITQNDGHHLRVNEPISTVFISAPDIADYNVVDENTIVIFAKEVGQAKIIIYGEGKKVLLSDRIVVDIDLISVRRQLRAFYPNLDVKIESIGEQVVVSGVVNNEQERDDIYRLVANLLGREKIERYESTQQLTYENDTISVPEPEAMIFSRNMTWNGIIEQIQVAAVQQVNVKISIAQVTETFGQTIGVRARS